MIYTDHLFLKELRDHLTTLYGAEAARDVDYSEQGMQGTDYVSLDVGKIFLKAFRNT